MKTIVGVDLDGLYSNVLHLLHRLQFPNATVTLLHSADAAMPVPSIDFGSTSALQAEMVEAVKEAGERLLEKAKAEACELGMKPATELMLGPPTPTLLSAAVDEHADLVAVTSARKGPFGSLFFGSVSRGLAIGAPCPVLVAKGVVKSEGKLTVVFATDHSEYANRCLDQFLKMRPQGIERLILVSAYEVDDTAAAVLHMNLAHLGGMVDEWIVEKLHALAEPIVLRLRAAGIPAEARVMEGHPNEVLKQVMAESEADLLILGAQGHSFMERVVIGSVSLHHVVAEPYSVLLMRA